VIVGFSKYSKGPGNGPVDYLTRMENPDGTFRTPPPAVLEGDAELVRRLIDALPFKRKYTSGVLSFAPGEIITPEMERNIMEGFEHTAFAGLQADRYSILWVRHEHAGHHELHFLVPRVELSTEKSLNIHPPGKTSRKMFDTFRSMVNARYGLADPDDPARARDVSLPAHVAKLKADCTRKGERLKQDIREIISESVRREVMTGRITDRNGVVRYLEAEGFTINRQGKDYISVIDAPGSRPIRLKGVLYAEGPLNAVRANMEPTEAIHDAPDPVKASALAEQLEGMVSARTEYHRKRYGMPEQAGEPQEGESLRAYLARNLGDGALRPRRWQGYGYEQGVER
jgi:Relaxase/Mobilisation nuclease domain